MMIRRVMVLSLVCLCLASHAQAAFTVTNLTTGGDTTCNSGGTTASITPTANALVLACVVTEITTAPVGTVTLVGNGLTWVEVATQVNDANTLRATLLRASGAAPSTGTVAITASADQGNCTWAIAQITGQDTSGTDGSGAIVQSAGAGTIGGQTSVSVTLGAFASASNGTFECVASSASGAETPGAGFAEVGAQSVCCGSRAMNAWTASNDTSVDATGTSGSFAIIGAEIKLLTTPTRRPFPPRHYLHYFLDWLMPSAHAFSMRSGPPGGGIIPPPATADYFVAPTGLDTNPGTEAQPWKTIQHAATAVTTAGAIVSVASGTYNERVVFPNSGTAGNEIEFVGQGDSTVVDGGVDLTGWTQSGGSYHSAVWERAVSAFGFGGPVPAHATASGKMIAFLKPGELGAVGNQDVWMNRAVGDAGWLGIQAVCAHYNTVTRCRFEDGTNPNNIDFKIAPERVGIFHIDNKSYLKFRGFKFINGYSGIIMRNFAHHITFENNTILHGYHAIEVSGGAHHITIQNNTTDLQWRYVDHGHSNKNTGGTTNTTQNNILQMLRSRMPITSTVLVEDVGTDVKILTNTFDRTAAAGVNVRSLNNNYENAAYGQQNLEIANNTIGHCQDYCVQVQLTVAPNSQIHDNLFNEYNSGIRLGQIYNAQGPMYIYRNKFKSPLGPSALCAAADLEISGYPNPGTSCFTGTAMYFYHNSSTNADCGIVAYSGQNLDNYYFVNNIISAGRAWVFELVQNPDFFSSGWIGGTSIGGQPSWVVNSTWAMPARIWGNDETAFALPTSHVAINAGINLSTTWTAGAQGSKPALPGMTAGYYLGTAADLGAVQKE